LALQHEHAEFLNGSDGAKDPAELDADVKSRVEAVLDGSRVPVEEKLPEPAPVALEPPPIVIPGLAPGQEPDEAQLAEAHILTQIQTFKMRQIARDK